jgi:hypothetical protein
MCVRCILDDSLHHKDHTNGTLLRALVEMLKSPLTHATAGVYLTNFLRQCPLSGRSRWPEPAASSLSLNGTNDRGRTRAGLGPAQCRCPLWAAIGRKLTRSSGPKQSPEGLLRPAAVGTTRRALRVTMPTAGSRFAARRAVQSAWSMHAGNLQAARQLIACDGLAGPRSVC